MPEENDMFSISDGSYITIAEKEFENRKYIFTSKLDNEENPTKTFIIFKSNGTGISKVTKKDELDKVLPFFNDIINRKIQEYDSYVGGDNNE